MAFDLSNVVRQADDAITSGNDKGNKYGLFYPGVGTSIVKLLFNPKSNSLFRLINRHEWLDKQKVPCLKTYGKDIECPICKAIQEVKNSKGIDLTRHKSKVRGIGFAHLVEIDYPLTSKFSPSPGDIVLFMFPWTVYTALSQTVADAKEPGQLEQLIASNEGYAFNIRHSEDNKYTVMPGMFRKYQTCKSEEEFTKLLENLDSLKDMILPPSMEAITDEQMTKINQVANEIRMKYLYGESSGKAQSLDQLAGNSINSAESRNSTDLKDKPPCFGKVNTGDIDSNSCLVCPCQAECQSFADDLPF
jgi:hypothetical protein